MVCAHANRGDSCGSQIFERLSTGARAGRGPDRIFHALRLSRRSAKKLRSAARPGDPLPLHRFPRSWFPAPRSSPGATRRDRDTQFLLAWIALFFAGAVIVFFAGSARYLLPMAAPVALLASRLRPRWLALGFALQMALSLASPSRTTSTGPPIARSRQFSSQLANGTPRVGGWRMGPSLLPRNRPARFRSRRRKRCAQATSWFRARSAMRCRLPLRRPPSCRSESAARFRCASSGSKPIPVSPTRRRGLWPFGVSSGLIDRVTRLRHRRAPHHARIPADGSAGSPRTDCQRHLRRPLDGRGPRSWRSRAPPIATQTASLSSTFRTPSASAG